MPTRLLLDGDDLQSLMLRVREEMGPDARIVKAERIRTGGLAGFFAREHYELTVEVPDRSRLGRGRRSDPAVPAGDLSGLDALLAAADADELDQVVGDGTPVGPAAADGQPVGSDVEPPPARVSTAGAPFAQVLESMRQIVGPTAEPAGTTEAVGTTTEPEPTPEPEPEPTPEPGPEPEPEPAPGPGPVAAAPVPEHSGSSVTALLELGVPTRLLAGFADPHAGVPLSVLVRRFDQPPNLRLAAGTVVAVVGQAHDALRTATQMAHRVAMDPRDIVLAGDIEPVAGHGRRLQTASAVSRYRSRVPPDAPAIVVIGTSDARESWDDAADLLAALDPDHAWAVLDARRKGVELRRWLRTVGARRPFDAVAATSTFDAQAPGTVLNLGTPVGWVDGLPASPVVWAAVLSERLADDARWD